MNIRQKSTQVRVNTRLGLTRSRSGSVTIVGTSRHHAGHVSTRARSHCLWLVHQSPGLLPMGWTQGGHFLHPLALGAPHWVSQEVSKAVQPHYTVWVRCAIEVSRASPDLQSRTPPLGIPVRVGQVIL